MERELKIESNIPIDNTNGQVGGVYHNAFMKMNEGDSFVIPTGKRMNAYMAGRKFGKVTTRKIDDQRLRVWLVKKSEHVQGR